MTDINLRILLSAQNAASGVIKAVVGDLKGPGGLQGALTAVGVAAAGMAVAIGVEAVNKAAAFQNAMLQNVAHAGLAKNQFDAVSQSVLQMSTDVGQMPTDLAQGLYPILSGFSGITNESAKAQTSLEDLRLAAEDVVGTETKTTVTSGALTSAFNALGLQTNNTATNISRLKTLNDQMEATVIAGNMHWDQYANVVGKLATAIKGTNVQWTEASAALATMTNEGFTAQRSQTYLANLFTQLDLKTDSLNKNAKKLHITFDEVKFKSMSLTDQLTYLKDITGGNASEVLKLLNNNATALKTYNALESGMKAYKTNLDAIKNSHGATATAFQTASSSFSAAKDRFKAAIDVLLIDLGTQLLPVLSKVLDWVTPLVKRFADWVANSKDLHTWISNVGSFLQYQFLPTVQNIAGAVQTFVGWMQQGSAPAQALKLLLGAIVTMNVAKSIGDAATSVLSLGTNAMNFITGSGAKLLAYFSPGGLAAQVTTSSATMEADLAGVGAEADATSAQVATVGTAAEADAIEATAATGTIGGAFSGLLGIISDVAGAIAGLLGPLAAIGLVASTIPSTFDSMNQQGMLPDWLKTLIYGKNPYATSPHTKCSEVDPILLHSQPNPILTRGRANHYASGGPVMQTGPAIVHQGEYVVPAGGALVARSGGGHTFNFYISTMAGSRSEINRMVDLLEREVASRFRGQTSYGFGGVV